MLESALMPNWITQAIALYAAVVSTFSAAVSFLNWLDARKKDAEERRRSNPWATMSAEWTGDGITPAGLLLTIAVNNARDRALLLDWAELRAPNGWRFIPSSSPDALQIRGRGTTIGFDWRIDATDAPTPQVSDRVLTIEPVATMHGSMSKQQVRLAVEVVLHGRWDAGEPNTITVPVKVTVPLRSAARI
ncbi:hypothetical protein [Methylobacterium phyllosphaerae]|uniref:hypothetical protein n=1 Tax=Methylobacterium phyllosphaerae TaxID=418223 RepID=UPI001113436F|nr:hypothetical protein [Methylobacterium phyllosphaerae]